MMFVYEAAGERMTYLRKHASGPEYNEYYGLEDTQAALWTRFREEGLDRIRIDLGPLHGQSAFRFGEETGGIITRLRSLRSRQLWLEDPAITSLHPEFYVAGVGAGVFRAAVTSGLRGVAAETIAEAADTLTGAPVSILAAGRSLLKAPSPGLRSTINGGPIDPADLARMRSAFESNGGKILQNADVDGYLRFRGAEGVTDNAKQILLRSDASRSAVFEEFIHTAQHRTGRFNDAVGRYGNTRGEAFLEIEAAEKLIRNRKAWQIPNSETRQTIERLRNYRNIFNGE